MCCVNESYKIKSFLLHKANFCLPTYNIIIIIIIILSPQFNSSVKLYLMIQLVLSFILYDCVMITHIIHILIFIAAIRVRFTSTYALNATLYGH